MSWFSKLVSAPFRAVATIVDLVDDQDLLGIAEASDKAAETVKDAVERITGEDEE